MLRQAGGSSDAPTAAGAAKQLGRPHTRAMPRSAHKGPGAVCAPVCIFSSDRCESGAATLRHHNASKVKDVMRFECITHVIDHMDAFCVDQYARIHAAEPCAAFNDLLHQSRTVFTLLRCGNCKLTATTKPNTVLLPRILHAYTRPQLWC